jgi:hypothetical protein
VELASTLADVSTQVIDEADAAFPADRLTRQHARNPATARSSRPTRSRDCVPRGTRRRGRASDRASLEALDRGDRGPLRRIPRRIYTEHFAHQFPLGRTEVRMASRATTRLLFVPGAVRTVVASVSDDEFLGQIELAVGSTGPAVLAPIDALTPRAWDVQ